MGSPERIKNVAQRVAKYRAQGHQVVVVVSAMSGETNRLIALAHEIQKHPDPRELDVVISTGEQVTIGLLSMALIDAGLKAKSYTGAQVKILTNSAFTKARIESIDDARVRANNRARVIFETNRYSVPPAYANRALVLKLWFHLSKPAQKKRFKELLSSKKTAWRVGAGRSCSLLSQPVGSGSSCLGSSGSFRS